MTPSHEDKTDRGQLASRLRRLRKEAGLTGTELAESVGVSQSKISKLETGHLLPTLEDIAAIGSVLNLSSEDKAELTEIAQSLYLTLSRWRGTPAANISARQRELAVVEEASLHIRVFNPHTFPGLVQTAEFARQLLARRFDSEEELSSVLVERMRRQQSLYTPKKRFSFVLGEPAFRWRIADNEAMRGQLAHLLNLSTLRNIEVRVLSFGDCLPRVPHGSFALFDEKLVTLETFTGELSLKESGDISEFAGVFEELHAAATRGKRCRDLITSVMNNSFA